MLLASVADIREQLGFDDMTDINFAAMMALDAADPQLAAMLNSDFEPGAGLDTFYVRQPPYLVGGACATEFRLRTGVLSALTSVKVGYAITDFDDPACEDITAQCTVDKDRGVVKNLTRRFKNQYVQIAYAYGIPADATDPTSYDLTKVPDWLQHAAKLTALIGLADSPSLSETQIKLDKTSLTFQRTSMLSRKLRYAPLAVLPL